MKGLDDEERAELAFAMRCPNDSWVTFDGAPSPQVARLVGHGRLRAEACPRGRPHTHVEVTPAGREAYRLDTLARAGVTTP